MIYRIAKNVFAFLHKKYFFAILAILQSLRVLQALARQSRSLTSQDFLKTASRQIY